MDKSTSYDAYLEGFSDGRWRARILDLSGCWGDGATEQQALDALTTAVPAYFDWLRAHDEYTPVVSGPFMALPRESQPPRGEQGRAVGAFFAPDAQSVSDEALEWELTLLDWAYADLLAAISLARDNPPVEQVLAFVVRSQQWLQASFDPALAPNLGSAAPAEPAAYIEALARAVLASLRAATPPQRSAVRDSAGERWSLRKVLRRSIELVRQNTQSIGRLVDGAR
jgi:predicted RNase H-like HicB family nuclease